MSLTAELISEIDERTERISQDQRRMNRIISYHVRSAIAEERSRFVEIARDAMRDLFLMT